MNNSIIINEILNDMPNNLKSKLEQARYLYLELCKRCHYNINFKIEDSSQQKIIYNSEIENKKDVIATCNIFSEIGSELFKKVGIEAMPISINDEIYTNIDPKDELAHFYFLFSFDERDEKGNKKFYLADPSFDLKRVQIGYPTKYFASRPTTVKNKSGYPKFLTTVSKEKLKQIDLKLGYCNEQGYTDTIVNNIINSATQKHNILSDKVEEMLDELQKQLFSKYPNIGISDRQSAYKMIFHQAFPHEMDRNIIDFETIKNDRDEYISKLVVKQGKIIKEYLYKENDGYIYNSSKLVEDSDSRDE